MNLEELYKLLKSKGQRITKQKEIILSVLVQNRDRLLSVNNIMELLPEAENINNATVYRNVQNFMELGILESLIGEDGIAKYMLRCDDCHHHHLICLECGKIIPIVCDKEKFNDITDEFGFEEAYHNLEVYGKCKHCAQKDK